MSKIFKNAAIVSPSYDGHANGVNFIALNENGDSGQSAPFDIPHTLGSAEIVSPIMTSDTTPDGICSASSVFSTNYAYFSFDRNSTGWIAGALTAWIQYGATSEFVLASVDITAFDNVDRTRDATNFDIQASKDGITFDTLDTQSGITWTQAEVKNFTISSTSGYKYFRIDITLANGNNPALSNISFNGLPVTNPNSYLTLQDKATEAHQTIDNSAGTPSTKYNQDKSCANIFTTDVPVTGADRVICDADELAVLKLVKGDLTTGLSFSASNVKNLWLGNEGAVGGSSVYDTVNDTSIVISGYTANCRDYFKNLDTKAPTDY